MEDEQVRGILSERDYARKVILIGRSSLETKVHKIMTTKVLYISLDKTVEEGLVLMSDKRCRHLPVFENNKLAGMVSIGDLVSANVAEKDFMISQLENYILSNWSGLGTPDETCCDYRRQPRHWPRAGVSL